MLTVDEVRKRVLESVNPLDAEEVRVAHALGLVLAEDVRAPHSLPRFANSAMDGYAVRGADAEQASADAPVELRLVGEIRAGDSGDLPVGPGAAVRIMTGAPLPPGADAVVQVEETEERNGVVQVKGATASGRNVRPAGDDVSEGDLVVAAGTELGPGELALLASLGASPLKAIRRPLVATIVTGDELIAPEQDPQPGQIRDSNSVALRTLVLEAGGKPLEFPPVADDRDATIATFERAARDADLIVSSGGVSVGRYDFVKSVVEELGAIELWRVAMQPGKPIVVGDVKSTPFIGLPGNPVSIHVGFEQFVRPAIRRMRGCASLQRPLITAELAESVHKKPGRLHFVRVRLDFSDGHWRATPAGPQGSHIQSSLVGCHGVARFPKEASELPAGADVEVEVWRLPEINDG
jgi:molybdopterin molybdotransferase